ncbi:unnamed protein product [Lampetra fluviatilis]
MAPNSSSVRMASGARVASGLPKMAPSGRMSAAPPKMASGGRMSAAPPKMAFGGCVLAAPPKMASSTGSVAEERSHNVYVGSGTPVTNPVGEGAANADQCERDTDLLLVAVGQLVAQLSASAPAVQGTVSGLRGTAELPYAAAIPAAETMWLPGAILPVEGMAWLVGAVWSGPRGASELPPPVAIPRAETTRLPGAILP